MDWSKEETFVFLEMFKKEPVIWDPNHELHKNSQNVNDAWVRLSGEMNRPISELKNKKNSLMATFRHHLRRKKQSLKSGAEEYEIYKPVWLYYDAMEAFLASVYKCHTIPIKTEYNEGLISPFLPNVDNDTYHNYEVKNELIDDQPDELNSEKQEPANKKIFKSHIKRKRPREDTVSNFNSVVLDREESGECELYAQLLATRLREYSKQERRQIMHDIDGLLLANPPTQLETFDTYNRYSIHIPSPTYSSSSSNKAESLSTTTNHP